MLYIQICIYICIYDRKCQQVFVKRKLVFARSVDHCLDFTPLRNKKPSCETEGSWMISNVFITCARYRDVYSECFALCIPMAIDVPYCCWYQGVYVYMYIYVIYSECYCIAVGRHRTQRDTTTSVAESTPCFYGAWDCAIAIEMCVQRAMDNWQ